jgi:peptidyl-prolyl cis-trans isomerase A (cyclophilin A)
MAWAVTIDEQDLPLAGGGYQDAPFSLSTTFRLAPGVGQKALGLLTVAGGTADNDAYSLGLLYKGSYTFTVALGTWYTGAGFTGTTLPSLGLFSSVDGTRVALSSAAGTLGHELTSPGSFLIGVIGAAGAPAAQYSLTYERVAPPNQPAQASTSIAGSPVPGNVLSLVGSLSDANGTTSSSLAFQWTSGSDVVGSGSTYTVRAEDVGRAVDVTVSFVDDAGYQEIFSPAALAGRARSTTAPTVALSADLLALKAGQAAAVTFRLSAPSVNFSAEDVVVSGGTLSSFSGSGTVYTALFTPAAGSTTSGSLFVNGGRFSNAAGEFNEDGGDSDNRLVLAIDTVPPVAPKLVFDPTLTVAVAPQVRLQTTLGDVVMELQPARAPASVSNLLAYVEDGYYAGTLFHRVVPGFVVQGGGYTPGMVYKEPTYASIPLESANGLSNVRGSVAMARTNQPDSATSQFYVNLVDNSGSLDAAGSQPPGYAVFGTVVAGMAVVDALAAVPTSSSVPRTDVLITAATQTVPGLAQGRTATLALTDLEPGGTWQYSLDAGKNWAAGSGSTLVVPEGRYALGDILVRQTDAAGNPSADTNRFATEMVVDPDAPRVQAYAWKSHALLEGVRLESPGQPPVSTTTAGAVLPNGDVDPTIDLAATLPMTPGQGAAAAAVNLQDAVAILKMIAGAPVNPGGAPLSPYQALAADVDGNGSVSLTDALGVLRHAVGLPGAAAPSWTFVDEADPGMPARATTTPGAVPATLEGLTPADGHLGLVGVLRGDVDGSWAAPAGTPALPTAYFTELVERLNAPLDTPLFQAAQWGVYP